MLTPAQRAEAAEALEYIQNALDAAHAAMVTLDTQAEPVFSDVSDEVYESSRGLRKARKMLRAQLEG